MKVLFLHLSDMHFTADRSYANENCKEIVDAIIPQIMGPIELIFLVVSGDIAFSGREEEYCAAENFLQDLKKEIIERINIQADNLYLFVVPGNHDRAYPEDRLSRLQYEQILNGSEDIRVAMENEFAMQNDFFAFAKREECNFDNKFFTRKIVEYNGFSFEINLLNTAPMSLLYGDDHGLHYLPDEVLNDLSAPTGADFVITIMHHSVQNFCDLMRAKFEEILYSKNSIVFSGHDHHHATQNISYNDNQMAAVFCGGALSNKGDWRGSEFFTCVFDTLTFECSRYRCCLNEQDVMPMYVVTADPLMQLPQKPSFGVPGKLQPQYIAGLFNDSQYGISQNVLDYFVFPRMRREIVDKDTLETEIASFEAFIKELENKKKIGIIGETGSGKTTLLKKIFDYYNQKKVVLLCSIDQVVTANRKRVLKEAFEDIYGTDAVDYEKYLRLPPQNKMLLIDDIHLIKPNRLAKFMEGVESEFGYIIYTSDDCVELKIEERIKSSVEKEQFTQYRLMKFYEDKRQELIARVVDLKLHDQLHEQDYADAISASLKKQRRYLSLTPSNILQYITYYIQNKATGIQTDSNIFGKVFEASITTAIQRYIVPPLSVEKVYIVLDKIAYYAHENRRYPIPYCDIMHVIEQYNDEYDDNVNIHIFVEVCLKSKVLHSCGNENEYKFLNNNYLAYFVAREIRRMCSDNNYDALSDVLKYACFGINASILMFISYLTDNLTPLILILEQAVSSVKDWDEFSFDLKEIKYLQAEEPFDVSAPTEREVEEDQKKALEKDRDEVDANTIDTVNIYDYSEDDLTKLTNRLSRALSLLIAVARCFPNFEHIMKKQDKERFVKQLYELPNKIFFAWAKDIEAHKSELIDFIVEFQTNEFKRQDFSKENALQVLQWESMSLLLELYYSAVLNAYKPNSYLHLIKPDYVDFEKEDTYKIERILVHELAGKVDQFISECEKVYDSGRINFKNVIVKRMVRHIMMTSKRMSQSQLDRAKSIFFSDKKQPDILVLRANNANNANE